MKIAESHIMEQNDGKRYGAYDDVQDLADTYMGEDATIGEIFRACQKEHGACTGKVYIDTREDSDPEGTYPRTIAIGWVFVKREKYEDSNETFLHETWISLLDEDRTEHIRRYHELGTG
jgi:hypothetical protein